MLICKYIDKRQFAISAIRDFNNMKIIINTTPEKIKETDERTMDADSIEFERSTQEKIQIQNIKGDLVKKRYKNAMEYMEWFLPVWDSLKKQDQRVLHEFYMSENLRSGASVRLQHELNYSERHIDRLRSNALDELAYLLLGE